MNTDQDAHGNAFAHGDDGPVPTCFGDYDGNRAVTVDELVMAVRNALDGCP
jgi:hypothetical protein